MNPKQVKQHYMGCGIAILPQPIFSYPIGHPCYGCPYTFETDKPSCTMGGRPSDCPWHFYLRMMSSTKAHPTNGTERKTIAACMGKLYQVAEKKFGKEYAQKLRQRRTLTT